METFLQMFLLRSCLIFGSFFKICVCIFYIVNLYFCCICNFLETLLLYSRNCGQVLLSVGLPGKINLIIT